MLVNRIARTFIHPNTNISDTARLRAFLLAEETYASVLLLIVVDKYGLDVLTWAPQTIRRQLSQDFSLDLPKWTLDKILATVMVVTTNAFYKDLRGFIHVCNILSGDEYQPEEFDPADAAEILWGVLEANLIWPPDDDPEDTLFSPEIRGYIEEVLQEEGIARPPDVLRLGLNPRTADKIRADYADDPDLYASLWEVQDGKTQDLQQVIYDNVRELLTQIRLLPIRNGQTDNLTKQLEDILDNEGQE